MTTNPQVSPDETVFVPRELVRPGVAKLIHVDRVKVQTGIPAVVVRTERGWLRCSRVEFEGAVTVGQWAQRAYEGGPNSWVETTAEVSVFGCVEVFRGRHDFAVDWTAVATPVLDR